MADVTISIQKTLVHEGGYVDNPNDSGGATNFGITQADMPGQDMKELTQAQAITYYFEHYVKQFYTKITNQLVLDKLFDMGVLFGVGTAVKILQRTVGAIPDGSFGLDTLQDVNAFNPDTLLTNFKVALVSHAITVAASHPQDGVFLKGWENRINA
jgi:lysozyme family protein